VRRYFGFNLKTWQTKVMDVLKPHEARLNLKTHLLTIVQWGVPIQFYYLDMDIREETPCQPTHQSPQDLIQTRFQL
jgi:hypothetical protein